LAAYGRWRSTRTD